MGRTAADFLCEPVPAWGVDSMYGFPGDGISAILAALRHDEDRLRLVHAQCTGQVGAGALHAPDETVAVADKLGREIAIARRHGGGQTLREGIRTESIWASRQARKETTCCC